ncbi:hypothetical protein EG329_011763 [Mollisiaceae sp. DMI_Dod_QoI]|nr:hypothetical protein EG329_011763 [Helotiales sp. DMI_Dod_QoI]
MDRRLEKYEILRMVNLFNKTHPNDKIFINEYVNLQSGEGSDIMKILDDRERRINVEADPVRTQAITAKSFVDGILKIDGIEERRAFPWESAESSLKVLISMVTKTRRKFDRERLQALGGPRVPGSRKNPQSYCAPAAPHQSSPKPTFKQSPQIAPTARSSTVKTSAPPPGRKSPSGDKNADQKKESNEDRKDAKAKEARVRALALYSEIRKS